MSRSRLFNHSVLALVSLWGVALVQPSQAAPACSGVNLAQALDTSGQVTTRFLKNIRHSGVTTIARYYDHPDETLPGKTLSAAELKRIAARHLNVIVVFQHHNDQLASFTADRGRADGLRSLELAGMHHQPAGSAIYFGVDGSWSQPTELAGILGYFQAVKDALAGSGYRVGVYGGGLVCKRVIGSGLADLCWLSNARSWPGYDEAMSAGAWAIRQESPVHCGGRDLDFDHLNPAIPDVGQFTP